MKMVIVAAVAIVLASSAQAAVSVAVYHADERTPLMPADPNVPDIYRDVMVGTRLTLFVSSDTAEYWWAGGLWMSWADLDTGTLLARDFLDEPNMPHYEGSRLKAAGDSAHVTYYNDSIGAGFDLITDRDAVPGDWFVLDYRAEALGLCDVQFYDYGVALETPVEVHTFNHVPSRDFNGDTFVNFTDFAMMTAHWSEISARDPINDSSFDLDEDNAVNMLDIALFSEYWLERTDCNEPNSPI